MPVTKKIRNFDGLGSRDERCDPPRADGSSLLVVVSARRGVIISGVCLTGTMVIRAQYRQNLDTHLAILHVMMFVRRISHELKIAILEKNHQFCGRNVYTFIIVLRVL